MKADRILDMIGDARGDYVWQAQGWREGMLKQNTGRLSLRKPLLIAAIIAAMLLLAGCVAYVLSLNDVILEQWTREDSHSGEVEVGNRLSLHGYVGSPGYQATKEWFAWKETYDPDGSIREAEEAAAPDRFSFDDYGVEYWEYDVYSQEMKDKIDEICGKYNLELLGKSYTCTNMEDFYRVLKIDGVLKPEAEAEFSQGGSRYFFENGSFEIEKTMTLTGEDNPWPYPSTIAFRCSRKDAFYDVGISIGAVEDYDQWVYKTSDGVEVLLVMDEKDGLMFVDKGDYFLTVTGIETHAGNILDGEHQMERAGMEALAEVFDFTIQPQRVGREAAQAVDQEYYDAQIATPEEEAAFQAEWNAYFGVASYEERVKYHLSKSSSAERLGYTFRDLDGDGMAELIIGKDGYINYMYTDKSGAAEEIFGPLTSTTAYLTEDGYLVSDHGDSVLDMSVYFRKFENGQLVTESSLRYSPYFLLDGATSAWQLIKDNNGTPITEAEYHRLRNAKKRVVLEMEPLTEYPLSREVEMPYIDRDMSYYPVEDTFAELARNAILNPSEGLPGEALNYRFALRDLDGDGQEELLWDEEYYRAVLAEKDGQLYCLFSGETLNLCQGNIIEVIHNYSGHNRTYCYYRVENGKGVNAAYLRYDEDLDPGNPWFRSCDASGQDTSLVPITEAEFNRILAQYVHTEPGWKPVMEYPLN